MRNIMNMDTDAIGYRHFLKALKKTSDMKMTETQREAFLDEAEKKNSDRVKTIRMVRGFMKQYFNIRNTVVGDKVTDICLDIINGRMPEDLVSNFDKILDMNLTRSVVINLPLSDMIVCYCYSDNKKEVVLGLAERKNGQDCAQNDSDFYRLFHSSKHMARADLKMRCMRIVVDRKAEDSGFSDDERILAEAEVFLFTDGRERGITAETLNYDCPDRESLCAALTELSDRHKSSMQLDCVHIYTTLKGENGEKEADLSFPHDLIDVTEKRWDSREGYMYDDFEDDRPDYWEYLTD